MSLLPLIQNQTNVRNSFIHSQNHISPSISNQEARLSAMSNNEKNIFFVKSQKPIPNDNENAKFIFFPHGKRLDPSGQSGFVGGIDGKELGLSKKGIEQAHEAGKYFQKINFNPSFIGVSDLLRTRQTFEILKEYFDQTKIILFDITSSLRSRDDGSILREVSKSDLKELVANDPKLELLANKVRHGWLAQPGVAYQKLLKEAGLQSFSSNRSLTKAEAGESYSQVADRTGDYFNKLAVPWLSAGHEVLFIGHQGGAYVLNPLGHPKAIAGKDFIVDSSFASGEPIEWQFNRSTNQLNTGNLKVQFIDN